jgi:methylenetetrahydrofolate dehydrogenase (NADP+) / methenyltetrahydrofolate cyclohydrolase
VVIGRSNIVGMPVALLLNRSDCTVTIGHSRSKDLPGLAREADILIAAAGRPFMVKADWVKPGAIVIDVGTNRLEDGRLVGDVAFDEVRAVAGAITPVPGGVGPMTIAMLLSNTLKAARLQGQAGS